MTMTNMMRGRKDTQMVVVIVKVRQSYLVVKTCYKKLKGQHTPQMLGTSIQSSYALHRSQAVDISRNSEEMACPVIEL